jgi:hypothetical protein
MSQPPIKPDMVKIGDFWVQKEILTMQWDCDYHWCNGICCDLGCWFVEPERDRVAACIKEIAEYLRDRPELPFWKEGPDQWEFCDPGWDEGYYHSKAINNLCILQMPDGRCAVHAYCLDQKIPWESFKFTICVTWPLKFRVFNGEWHVTLHPEFNDPGWDPCICIRPEKLPPAVREKLPHVVESMKTTITSRIGEKRYNILHDYIKKNHGRYLQKTK